MTCKSRCWTFDFSAPGVCVRYSCFATLGRIGLSVSWNASACPAQLEEESLNMQALR